MRISSDVRRMGLFDIFADATPGQVNIIRLHAEQRCGWHRHQRQTDRYFCVSGTVTVGITDADGVPTWTTLYDEVPEVLVVPPNHWHGYAASGGEAVLLQYLNRKYDPDDEERHPDPETLWAHP